MEAGRLLGNRYLLVERLGEGGMSVVWRARDRVLGREVAVKVLGPRFATDADWRRRIRLEARAAARLSHPNITNVYDYGETDGHAPFVVMELLRGPTLAERLSGGPLPVAAALRIGAEVAAGLAAAHAEDLVHRDVKPANVMLTPDAAKLLDFGLVGVAGVPDLADPAELVLGTPAYLAPERLASDEVTPASDVYAFGVLLYRCLTGRLPWDSETTTQLVAAHMMQPPAPLPDLPGVPPGVRDLCMSCLAKQAGDRPAAAVVAARLAEAAGIVPRCSVLPPEPEPGAPEGPTELVARPVAASAHEPDRLEPDRPEPDRPEPGRRRVLAGFAVLAAIAALLVAVAVTRPSGLADAGRTGAGEVGIPYTPTPSAAPPSEAPSVTTPSPTATDPVGGRPDGNPAGQDDQGDQDDQGRGGPPAPATAGPSVSLPIEGGLIVAACAGRKAAVLQVLPVPGVRLVTADLGVHTNAHVQFDRAGERLRYTVSCPGGEAPSVTDG
ncbi:serine/threonine-protein kinase [Dactylosporangium salmoneum]|uniref:non-specific serine/threonine protein kinase n=1 Tax=Dactylosporangium salmoneum TaxID=53361 RepID=A0ABP5SDM1_9ACTN